MSESAMKVVFGFYYLARTQGKEAAYEVAKQYIESLELQDGCRDEELERTLFDFIEKVSDHPEPFENDVFEDSQARGLS